MRVSIIGAGTAGLIAAKKLASISVPVDVYDQKRVLGVPVRASGILSIKGLESLGIDYKGAVTNTLYGANLHAGRKTLKVRSREPIAHVLDRRILNQICHDETVAEGARVYLGKRIENAAFDRMGRNGIIIGADGAVSSVARHFGMGAMKGIVVTYKAVYEVEPEDSEMVDLYFDNGRYRGLFAWTCPNSDNMLEVGVGVDSRFGNAKARFDEFAASGPVKAVVGNSAPVDEGASLIPIGIRRRIVDPENNVMLIGDAAGQVKATTGGGIIYGGNAALIAADVIKEHIENGASIGRYGSVFMRRYAIDLALHNLIGMFYKNVSVSNLERSIGLMDLLGLSPFLGKYGDMDMPSVILKRFFLRNLID